LGVQTSLEARPARLTDQWRSLSPEEFETYRYVFAPYEIDTPANILVLGELKVFRIESSDYCAEKLCQTIVVAPCGRAICPSASIFVKRDVEDTGIIANRFGTGNQFFAFPLSSERTITVLINKRFVAAWHGFGEN